MPRQVNKSFEALGFKLAVLEGRNKKKKYCAFCCSCERVLQNTAEARLKCHKSVCKKSKMENNDVNQDVKHNVDECDEKETIPINDIIEDETPTVPRKSECDEKETIPINDIIEDETPKVPRKSKRCIKPKSSTPLDKKKKHYNQAFKEEWVKEFNFVTVSPKGKGFYRCNTCQSDLSCKDGRRDIRSHASRMIHQKNAHSTDKITTKQRKQNFNECEEILLLEISEKYKEAIESNTTGRGKEDTWKMIEDEFNRISKIYYRTAITLRNKYISMKKKPPRKITKRKPKLSNTEGDGTSSEQPNDSIEMNGTNSMSPQPSTYDDDDDDDNYEGEYCNVIIEANGSEECHGFPDDNVINLAYNLAVIEEGEFDDSKLEENTTPKNRPKLRRTAYEAFEQDTEGAVSTRTEVTTKKTRTICNDSLSKWALSKVNLKKLHEDAFKEEHKLKMKMMKLEFEKRMEREEEIHSMQLQEMFLKKELLRLQIALLRKQHQVCEKPNQTVVEPHQMIEEHQTDVEQNQTIEEHQTHVEPHENIIIEDEETVGEQYEVIEEQEPVIEQYEVVEHETVIEQYEVVEHETVIEPHETEICNS